MLLVSFNHLLTLPELRNCFQEEKSSRRVRLEVLACSSLDLLSQPPWRWVWPLPLWPLFVHHGPLQSPQKLIGRTLTLPLARFHICSQSRVFCSSILALHHLCLPFLTWKGSVLHFEKVVLEGQLAVPGQLTASYVILSSRFPNKLKFALWKSRLAILLFFLFISGF